MTYEGAFTSEGVTAVLVAGRAGISRAQLKLGSNVYGNLETDPASGLEESLLPSLDRTIITHEVPMSTIWPQDDLGPKPPLLEGTMRMAEANVHTFVTDVCDDSLGERVISWYDCGVEAWTYVVSGVITGRQPVNMGGGAVIIRVGFRFLATRTWAKKVSDNAILWGG